jgi:hypothetical protein
LVLIGTLVDDDKVLATALMNRTGPMHNGDGAQSIKPGIAKMSFVKLQADHRLTVAMGGKGVELARATIGAVTGG